MDHDRTPARRPFVKLRAVRKGASVWVTGATIKGDVVASDAAAVTLPGAKVKGSVAVDASGPVSLEGSGIGGPVSLRGNDTYTLVAGDAINDKLACSGNDPAPTNNPLPNMVTGKRMNQCAPL
jgi:hypothetical protein